jgi:hypothetical protein
MYCEPLAKDVASLRSIGGDFCTSYLGYSPSAVVSTVTETPAVSTVQATTIELTTEISTSYIFQKRVAVPTPSFIANWPAKKISAACSQVATGLTSTTTTTTAPTPYVTEIVATSTSTMLSAATETCQASLIKGGDIQNGLRDWRVSGNVDVLEDHSAVNYHAVGCGHPSCSGPASVGGSIQQTVNFGNCTDQSYTVEFTYQASGDYRSPYLCQVYFAIEKCEPYSCPVAVEPENELDWYITSTGGSWKTWSQTFTPRSGVENLDLNLGLSLACQWYSQVDILVKDFSVRASST